ncbi:MAG: cation:proton antiporter [Oscillospiraceae bacterium]|jgi:Kef-type K+ transport system membrane component KefB|nr:cation:proton antiporter [Oscillospiraceae bacterium]MDD3262063.1 cation:proton antiporter [Oscillospiraceae bacterium]
MTNYNFLLDIALILLSTKFLGLVTRKIRMPQVVGALLAGLVLGPVLHAITKTVYMTETDFLSQLSEIGVITLMFTAGVETDLKEMKKAGKACFVIALIGVLVPLFAGFGLACVFNTQPNDAKASLFLQNWAIGVVLTATSVSITVETLKELGKLSTRAGSAILGAAVIDDVLGIICLTLITSMADASVNIGVTMLKIVAFLVLAVVIGILFNKLFEKYQERFNRDMRRFVIIAFAVCLIFSYCAEKFFGVADITGAYIAGMMISNTQRAKYISARFETINYAFLSPIFFASVGLKVSLPNMSASLLLFAVLLAIVAILSKVVGCGLGAKICGLTNRESVQVGMGMISRGEVALIVASKCATLGLMSKTIFGPVIIVVIVTTIVSPILLKLSFKDKKSDPEKKQITA